MHKMAKKVLVEWLSSCDDGGFENLSYRLNYVMEEYPLAIKDKFDSSLTLWGKYKDAPTFDDDIFVEGWTPTFDWCIANQLYPYAVVDVMVSHKGSPCYGFEVVYKHPCDQEKINKLKQHCNKRIEIYEISAEWILKQTKKPQKLRFIRRII